MSGTKSILGEILLPWQQRWVADRSRFKIGLWSRQTGKSFSTACEAVTDCAEQGSIYPKILDLVSLTDPDDFFENVKLRVL